MFARFGGVACLLLPALGVSQTPAPAAPPAGPAVTAPALTPSPAGAQNSPQGPQTIQTAAAPRPQIRTGTQLVVVDVVVQDSAGHPVHGLTRNAFQVTENKAPQTLAAFEEHSTAHLPPHGPELPPMPPGTFTNYTPLPPGGALNILLVDALNTPMPDQAYLRNQLKEYVNNAQPGARTAIFALNTRLFMLQGFTSNPETLKDAVNHKLIPRSSNLMDNALDGASDTSMSDAAADAGMAEVAHALQQSEAVDQSYKLQLRLQYTLDAFNALAHYLSAFPGRKNLLWFSGSFPINILPNATLDNPFSVLQVNEDEFRDTTDLLSRSEVAVYPIDARGLMTEPFASASNSGAQYARDPTRFSRDVATFNQSQTEEHMTMDQMASETGGRAFYNTNGLAAAAAKAIDGGSNFYTIAYTPTDRNPHGEHRSIRVALSGAEAPAGLSLSYRRGYYATNPQRAARVSATALAKAAAAGPATPATPAASEPATQPSNPTPAQAAATAYNHAAMLHGAPTPEDILFKARILPASSATDTELLPGDTADPSQPFHGPYRRYNIDIAALGTAIRFAPQPDGKRLGFVEFKTYVYDFDGKLLNINGRTLQYNITADIYKQIVTSGIQMSLQVSAPARGASYLRIAVHDLSSNRFGVVEVPTAAVSRLAPAPPPSPGPAPATSPPTPAAAPATSPAAPQ